jgi:hypothetical protein
MLPLSYMLFIAPGIGGGSNAATGSQKAAAATGIQGHTPGSAARSAMFATTIRRALGGAVAGSLIWAASTALSHGADSKKQEQAHRAKQEAERQRKQEEVRCWWRKAGRGTATKEESDGGALCWLAIGNEPLSASPERLQPARQHFADAIATILRSSHRVPTPGFHRQMARRRSSHCISGGSHSQPDASVLRAQCRAQVRQETWAGKVSMLRWHWREAMWFCLAYCAGVLAMALVVTRLMLLGIFGRPSGKRCLAVGSFLVAIGCVEIAMQAVGSGGDNSLAGVVARHFVCGCCLCACTSVGLVARLAGGC